MKISTNEDGMIVVREAYNPIRLISSNGSILDICLRDGGFHINHNGETYFTEEGELVKLYNKKSEEENTETQSPGN